jgi:hypothetical protein
MEATTPFVEETFGILTDDELYLDCILVRPQTVPDEELSAIRVWVPKYPLTKNSVLTCARQEVLHYGERRKMAHLVFDLRNTGHSDISLRNQMDFDIDLNSIQEWAKERFGDGINIGFLGTPYTEYGRVNIWPLAPGSLMESYHYFASGSARKPDTLLYMSTYGNFGRADEAVCLRLAEAGYDVFGLDPLRYLLHASSQNRLEPEHLANDMRILVPMLPTPPLLIGQPLAAGLATLWASQVDYCRGVIAIGKSQAGLAPGHIFANDTIVQYLLSRYVRHIAPRPYTQVWLTDHSMGGDEQEIKSLYQSSKDPHRVERTGKMSFKLLLSLIEWSLEQTK